MLETRVSCSKNSTSSNTGIRPRIINTQTGITRESWNNTEEAIFTAPAIQEKKKHKWKLKYHSFYVCRPPALWRPPQDSPACNKKNNNKIKNNKVSNSDLFRI
jgi:hypothetical protein